MTATQNLNGLFRWRGWFTLAVLLGALAVVTGVQVLVPARAHAKIACSDLSCDDGTGGGGGGGDTGSGDTGDTGSGDTGSGDTGSGDTGDTGSGDTGWGDTGSGDTGSSDDPQGGSGDVGGGYVGDNEGDDVSAGPSTPDAASDDTQSSTRDASSSQGTFVDPFEWGGVVHPVDPGGYFVNPFDKETPTYLADPKMLDEIERDQALDAGRLGYDPDKTPVSNRPPTGDESKATPKAKTPSFHRTAPGPLKPLASGGGSPSVAPVHGAKASKPAKRHAARKHSTSHR
jgi:hypothetical protein